MGKTKKHTPEQIVKDGAGDQPGSGHHQSSLLPGAREFGGLKVDQALAEAMIAHGIPEYFRSGNGPELVAKQLRKWLVKTGVGTLYIKPGPPWENATPVRWGR